MGILWPPADIMALAAVALWIAAEGAVHAWELVCFLLDEQERRP